MASPLQTQWFRDLTREDDDPRITSTVIAIAAVLASYADKTGNQVRPGNERLADETRTSVPTVKRALRDLQDTGWLFLVSRGRYRTATPANVYRLVWPSERGITRDPSLVTPGQNEGSLVNERGITGSKNEGSPMTHYQSSDQSIDHFVFLEHDRDASGDSGGDDWDEAYDDPYDGPLPMPFVSAPFAPAFTDDPPLVTAEGEPVASPETRAAYLARMRADLASKSAKKKEQG